MSILSAVHLPGLCPAAASLPIPFCGRIPGNGILFFQAGGGQLFLKRIELQGFKSFADKTVLQFDQGVTGIVGPNGCGKSNINDAITHTCCLTAKDLDAKAILAATNSGRSARMICRFRPACPIAALTMHEKVRRQLNISWGVIPFLTGEVTSTDRIFSLSAEVALKEKLVQNGDTVVITAGVPLGKSGSTNLIKAQVIDEESM